MSSKKWVLVFLVTVFVLAALLAGLNLATDPFGAFGDRLLHWFSYDETNNPRVAKLSYLEQHHGEYDSYILGCSSTSSFPVDGFNELYDASFYNLIMYGADMRDCEKIADYLIGHYEVKNLVLNVYLDNGLEYDEESDRLTKNLHYKEDPDTSALSFYTRYLFPVMITDDKYIPEDVPDNGEDDETWMDMEDAMYERNDELGLAMADFLAIALQEGDNDGTNILEAYGYEVVDEILDGFLKELSEDYGFHIYRPMIVTEKESGCEVFTEFPYDEYDIDGVDEPEDKEDETETGE